MSAVALQCPSCGSCNTASRRQLFRGLMLEPPLRGAFCWYSERLPRACPPKSLFVILLLLMPAMSVPAIGMWLLEYYPAFNWLLMFALALCVSLLFDMTTTFRHYRIWDGEWLCGECRGVFQPGVSGDSLEVTI